MNIYISLSIFTLSLTCFTELKASTEPQIDESTSTKETLNRPVIPERYCYSASERGFDENPEYRIVTCDEGFCDVFDEARNLTQPLYFKDYLKKSTTAFSNYFMSDYDNLDDFLNQKPNADEASYCLNSSFDQTGYDPQSLSNTCLEGVIKAKVKNEKKCYEDIEFPFQTNPLSLIEEETITVPPEKPDYDYKYSLTIHPSREHNPDIDTSESTQNRLTALKVLTKSVNSHNNSNLRDKMRKSEHHLKIIMSPLHNNKAYNLKLSGAPNLAFNSQGEEILPENSNTDYSTLYFVRFGSFVLFNGKWEEVSLFPKRSEATPEEENANVIVKEIQIHKICKDCCWIRPDN